MEADTRDRPAAVNEWRRLRGGDGKLGLDGCAALTSRRWGQARSAVPSAARAARRASLALRPELAWRPSRCIRGGAAAGRGCGPIKVTLTPGKFLSRCTVPPEQARSG